MRKKKCLFWYLLISTFILFLDHFSLLDFLKNNSESVISPIKAEVYSVNIGLKSSVNAFLQYPNYAKILATMKRMEKMNTELTLKVRLLTEENAKLRNQLEAPLPANYSFVPASVLAVSSVMEIGVGKANGIKEGMIVVDGDVYVGRIQSLTNRRSSILLPTDLKSKIPVKTSRGVKGVLVGQSGKNMLLDEILQKDPLFLADFVVTSGEGNYPPNLLIGKIVHITVSDVEVYKEAVVEPLLDYKQLQTVFVIKES